MPPDRVHRCDVTYCAHNLFAISAKCWYFDWVAAQMCFNDSSPPPPEISFSMRRILTGRAHRSKSSKKISQLVLLKTLSLK